jgi:hypothetical protein
VKTYQKPALPEGTAVMSLAPEDSVANALTPETVVTCLNRGSHELRDKFDGRDYVIPGGALFELPYGAALHFKTRQVVPGTRDPHNGHVVKSFIAILGLDPAEQCRPFSDEAMDKIDATPEGLDREQMESPVDRDVQPRGLAQSSAGRSQGRRPHIDGSQQATSEAAERAAGAMTPPTTSAAEQDERASASDGAMARAGRKTRGE